MNGSLNCKLVIRSLFIPVVFPLLVGRTFAKRLAANKNIVHVLIVLLYVLLTNENSRNIFK